MDNETRKSYLPHEFYHMFSEYLDYIGLDDFDYPKDDNFDEELTDYELMDWLEKNDPQTFESFGEWLFNELQSFNLNIPHKDYPTWTYLGNPEIIKNQWLIHFTSDARSISNEGFTKGVSEMERLGLTTHISDFEKKYGGYNFAYTLKDFKRYARKEAGGGYSYGDEAVIFNASGIRMYHNGDHEYQVIFWGETAKNIIPITEGSDRWAVFNQKTLEEIYTNDNLEKVVDWIVKNYNQYRKALFSM